MTEDEQYPMSVALFNALGNVLSCARLVTVFDGTDRLSIEALRTALYNYGLIEEQVRKLDTNE